MEVPVQARPERPGPGLGQLPDLGAERAAERDQFLRGLVFGIVSPGGEVFEGLQRPIDLLAGRRRPGHRLARLHHARA